MDRVSAYPAQRPGHMPELSKAAARASGAVEQGVEMSASPLNDRHDPIVIACALFNYREIEVYAPNGRMLLAGKRGEPRWKWVVPKKSLVS